MPEVVWTTLHLPAVAVGGGEREVKEENGIRVGPKYEDGAIYK